MTDARPGGYEGSRRMMNTENLAPLAHYRKERGLTQKQLAAISGVNSRQIQRIEAGDSKAENLTLKNALALANALGIKPEDLIP